MIFSLILGASIAVQGSVASVQRAAPADVPRSHWAFEAVDGLFKEGLLVGYPPDGSFKGNARLSRNEMAALLERMTEALAERS